MHMKYKNDMHKELEDETNNNKDNILLDENINNKYIMLQIEEDFSISSITEIAASVIVISRSFS